MVEKSQMIIITSDTNLIEQINKTKTINLAFLSQLLQSNSTNDQVYKRALDSERDAQSKPAKRRRKSTVISCAVCNNEAIGYNYDVPSCASCKAFFYRNANQNLDNLRCLKGEDHCLIFHRIHRKCQKCRLKKCFQVGMKKEFLMSNDEKQHRKQINDEKKSFISISSDSLSPNDWLVIENIQSIFLSVFQIDPLNTYCENLSDQRSALIFWSHLIQKTVIDLIKYFRQIDHFEHLDSDDRFLLIKYNSCSLHPLLKCFHYHPIYNSFSSQGNEYTVKRYQFYELCFNKDNLNQLYMNLVLFFVQTTDQDSIIISLFILILLFTKSTSTNLNEPLLKYPLSIYQIQSYYIDILWKYLLKKYGHIESIKRFDRLIQGILQLQLLTKIFKDFLNDQFMSQNDVDQLAPLMQTVLMIS